MKSQYSVIILECFPFFKHFYLSIARQRLHTSNKNCRKAILWSKIWLLWTHINHPKSAAKHFFQIVCFRINVDLSNDLLCILADQGPVKLLDVKFCGSKKEKMELLVRNQVKSTKWYVALNTKCLIFFKSQILTSGRFSAHWPARIHNTSFERSHNLEVCFLRSHSS